MALHGHTKIELTDVHSGEKQVVQKHNLITNALQEIFTPVGAYTNPSALLHGSFASNAALNHTLVRLCGGLLLYDTPLGSDPDTLVAPATAHVTGAASYGYTNSDGINSVRGSYNPNESEIDLENNMVKFVFDFATNQANGVISSVCLSHRWAGLSADEDVKKASRISGLPNTRGDSISNSLSSQLLPWYRWGWGPYLQVHTGATKTNGILLELDEGSEEALLAFAACNTDAPTLTLRRYPVPLRSASLFWGREKALPPCKSEQVLALPGQLRTSTAGNISSSFDAERRTLYLVPYISALAVGATFYVAAVKVDTGEVTLHTLTNQTGATISTQTQLYPAASIGGYVYNGAIYVWGAGTDATRPLYRIKLDDAGDVAEVLPRGMYAGESYVSYAQAGRVYLYANDQTAMVLNTLDDTLRYTEFSMNGGAARGARVVPVRGRTVLGLGYEASSSDSANENTYGAYLQMRTNYLATINDLAAPVEKTADKTMKVTYILREGS